MLNFGFQGFQVIERLFVTEKNFMTMKNQIVPKSFQQNSNFEEILVIRLFICSPLAAPWCLGRGAPSFYPTGHPFKFEFSHPGHFGPGLPSKGLRNGGLSIPPDHFVSVQYIVNIVLCHQLLLIMQYYVHSVTQRFKIIKISR